MGVGSINSIDSCCITILIQYKLTVRIEVSNDYLNIGYELSRSIYYRLLIPLIFLIGNRLEKKK